MEQDRRTHREEKRRTHRHDRHEVKMEIIKETYGYSDREDQESLAQ